MSKTKAIPYTEMSARATAETGAHRNTAQKVVLRSWIVLKMMEGLSQEATAEQLETSRVTVSLWQKTYQGGGIQALLKDAPRSGRIPQLPAEKEKEIIEATLHSTPADAACRSSSMKY